MGLHGDIVREVMYDQVPVSAERRIGAEGQGMAIALAALDAGRLGISAAATGLAQAALTVATAYARERQQFGRAIGEFQGLAFLLADMQAAVSSARASYLYAARLKDAGRPFSAEAAAAKLTATDAAMRVTTDAVQVLGGAVHARGQGHPDLRRHQPDPAPRHQSTPTWRLTQSRAVTPRGEGSQNVTAARGPDASGLGWMPPVHSWPCPQVLCPM